jgi:hypothetical protein
MAGDGFFLDCLVLVSSSLDDAPRLFEVAWCGCMFWVELTCSAPSHGLVRGEISRSISAGWVLDRNAIWAGAEVEPL